MSTHDIFSEVETTVEELAVRAENLKEKVEATVNRAHWINDEIVNSSERYVPLDDQPYGEELIRTDGMLESIDKVLVKLEQAQEEDSLAKAVEIVQSVEESIDKHQETFDDCFSEDFIEMASKSVSEDWDY